MELGEICYNYEVIQEQNISLHLSGKYHRIHLAQTMRTTDTILTTTILTPSFSSKQLFTSTPTFRTVIRDRQPEPLKCSDQCSLLGMLCNCATRRCGTSRSAKVIKPVPKNRQNRSNYLTKSRNDRQDRPTYCCVLLPRVCAQHPSHVLPYWQ